MEHEWEALYGFAEALQVRCVHCGLEVMTDDGWTAKGPIEKDTTLPPCQLVLRLQRRCDGTADIGASNTPAFGRAGSTPVTDI